MSYVYKDWVKQHHLTYINAYNEALACIYYQTSATPLGIYNELKKSEPQEDDLHSLLRNVIYMQLLYLADEQDALDKLIRTIRVLLAQKRYENLIDEDDKAVRLFMIILNDIIRFKQKLKIKEEKKGGQSYFNIYNKIVQGAPTEKDWLLVQLMSC